MPAAGILFAPIGDIVGEGKDSEEFEMFPIAAPEYAVAPDDLHRMVIARFGFECQIDSRRVVVPCDGGLVFFTDDRLFDEPIPAEPWVLIEWDVYPPK